MELYLYSTLLISISLLAGSAEMQSFCPTSGAPTAQCRPCKRPDTGKDNQPPDVIDLSLEKTELLRPPVSDTSQTHGQEHSSDMVIIVKTTAQDPENDVLTYHYTVSGGRIVGTGANVNWDLNKVMPGTYTITAGVDDGCGICGTTFTRTVRIEEAAPDVLSR